MIIVNFNEIATCEYFNNDAKVTNVADCAPDRAEYHVTVVNSIDSVTYRIEGVPTINTNNDPTLAYLLELIAQWEAEPENTVGTVTWDLDRVRSESIIELKKYGSKSIQTVNGKYYTGDLWQWKQINWNDLYSIMRLKIEASETITAEFQAEYDVAVANIDRKHRIKNEIDTKEAEILAETDVSVLLAQDWSTYVFDAQP